AANSRPQLWHWYAGPSATAVSVRQSGQRALSVDTGFPSRPGAYCSAVELRLLRPDDWPAVAAIYADGIATGSATFETEVPSWESWDASHLPELRLVAVEGDAVVGWAAVSRVSTR